MQKTALTMVIVPLASAVMSCAHVEQHDMKAISANDIPKLVAHRGESAIAPENTVPAYELAWKTGRCRAVETDVHFTSDGVLVCCHDETTARTTGVDWRIKEKSFADLRTLDAGKFKGPEWTGTRIPSLEEVFRTLPPDGHIFVEIKEAGPRFAAAFEKARTAAGVTESQVTVISFVASELENVRKALPLIRTLLLLEAVRQEDGSMFFPTAPDIAKQALELGANGVDLQSSMVDAEMVKVLHDAGLEVHVWTVDSAAEARKMADFGVDSITTNRSGGLYDDLTGAR